jgi:sarcosine oxidase subunit gamma
MVDLRRWSPLEHRAADLARIDQLTLGAVQIAELPFLSQLDVRSADPAALGLPVEPNTWTDRDGADSLWLGPDEWLVVGEAAGLDVTELQDAASVVDVGANRAVLDLVGPGVLELLSRGCSLDLHPSRWTTGDCAQTMLAKAPVILQQRRDVTRIFVRPSFDDYLVEWFLAASG